MGFPYSEDLTISLVVRTFSFYGVPPYGEGILTSVGLRPLVFRAAFVGSVLKLTGPSVTVSCEFTSGLVKSYFIITRPRPRLKRIVPRRPSFSGSVVSS